MEQLSRPCTVVSKLEKWPIAAKFQNFCFFDWIWIPNGSETSKSLLGGLKSRFLWLDYAKWKFYRWRKSKQIFWKNHSFELKIQHSCTYSWRGLVRKFGKILFSMSEIKIFMHENFSKMLGKASLSIREDSYKVIDSYDH